MDSVTQLFDRFANLDPSGDEALLLCAIVAALLRALILLGFGLMRAPKRSSAPTRNTKELDLVTMWRPSRSLRTGAKPAPFEARAESSVKTAHESGSEASVRAYIALLVLAALLAGCQSVTQAPPPADSSRPPQALAVDPSDGSLLKAAGGVFRSVDQGASWSALTIPAELSPGTVKQVATTAAATGTLFAAGPGAGVIRSDDDGRTWTLRPAICRARTSPHSRFIPSRPAPCTC